MHLKSSVQWSPALKWFIGYEDFGNGACEEGDMATEALVLLAVSLTRAWRAPLAYFLTAKPLSAEQQMPIVREALLMAMQMENNISGRPILHELHSRTAGPLGQNILFYDGRLGCSPSAQCVAM